MGRSLRVESRGVNFDIHEDEAILGLLVVGRGILASNSTLLKGIKNVPWIVEVRRTTGAAQRRKAENRHLCLDKRR